MAVAELLAQWSDSMAAEQTTGQSNHLRATRDGEGGGGGVKGRQQQVTSVLVDRKS